MNRVDVLNTYPGPASLPDAAATERFLTACLQLLNLDDCEVSILITTDDEIQQLNRVYRNIDTPTDVLSFSQADDDGDILPSGFLGDVVVSVDTLRENCEYFDVTVEQEYHRLLLHGLLHLIGYDHASNNADEPMLSLQEDILAGLRADRVTE